MNSQSYQFKTLKSEDIASVKNLADLCFDDRWTEGDFAYFVEHECKACFGLWDRDRLVGYFLGLQVFDEMDVVSVAIDPKEQRKGFARRVLREALAVTGVQKAYLEVATDNEPALGLYKSEGFQVTGTRKGYYRGKRDAYNMLKILSMNH